MKSDLAKQLVDTLPSGLPTLFNPWKDCCQYDASNNGPAQRLERLGQHLSCRPKYILVGEAPGYQGCRYSGIAFTSERLLLEGAIPGIDRLAGRLSTRPRPFSEPSATIVWRTLAELGISDRTILWNALQLHPFKPDFPWSNRTPTDAELSLGEPALRLLLETFPEAKRVAVGQKAGLLLARMYIQPTAVVRHPANGGATKFKTGLTDLLKQERNPK